MSDNEEMMQTKNSSLEDSSGDESSSEAARNEFSSRDGEPVNKPRKVSSTSSTGSSSSEDEEGPDSDEEESSKSEAISKSEPIEAVSSESSAYSEHPQQPQPRSRSVSVEEAPAPASRKKSVASSIAENDTDDEVEDIVEASAPAASAPVPVERKVSAPISAPASHPEIVIDEAELTKDEVELSKRETVHLDEAQKAEVIAEVTRSSADLESADSESEEMPAPAAPIEAPVEAKPATIIERGSAKNGHDSDSSSESSEEGDMNIKPSHNNRFIESSPTTEEHHELNGRRSNNGIDVTKIYKSAVDNNNQKSVNNNNIEKGDQTRTKPSKDITQIYTQTIAKASPPASPRSMPRGRPASDITKLYTGKLETKQTPDIAKPAGPARKHNMSTAVDKDAIRQAYEDVRSDTSDTEWAVFKFDGGNRLGVTATGKEFGDFKNHFENDDRGFGYIRIKTGDEMSKRAKFVLVTWVGQNVSVMKKAKMSTDKALLKDIIQNMSVELQLENHGEFSADHFKMQVDKASGARYGTGVRDL